MAKNHQTKTKSELLQLEPQPVSEMVNSEAAAKIVGRSPDTLKRWRYEGIGPKYTSYRGRVRYDRSVLIEFNKENTRMPSVRAAMGADRGHL
jgi:hypothetical protein